MKRAPYIALALLAVASVLVSLAPDKSGNRKSVIAQFSPNLCIPGNLKNQINVVGDGISAIGVIKGKLKEVTFKKGLQSITWQGNGWLEVSDASAEPIMIADSPGLAMAKCSSLTETSWFVGGATDVSSQDQLLLANDGLSAATVEVSTWSALGAVKPTPVVIPPRKQQVIRLDNFLTGSKAVAVRIKPVIGRAAAMLFSSRISGLKKLGSDFISAGSIPSNRIYIPIAPGQKQVSGRILQVLNPNSQDAVLKIEILAPDGRFTPIGLDETLVPANSLRAFDLTKSLPTGINSIRIESEQAITASLLIGGADYAWSPAAPIINEPVDFLMPPKSALTMISEEDGNEVALTADGKIAGKIELNDGISFTWINKKEQWVKVQLVPAGPVHASIWKGVGSKTGTAVLAVSPRVRIGSGSTPEYALSVAR